METIRSFDNSKIKHIKKLLADKKYRAESGEFVAEGARWVSDALNAKSAKVFAGFSAIFIKESCANRFAELIQRAENMIGAESIFVITDSVFDKTSDIEHSQGILAVLKVNREHGVLCPRILYLDGIRDPGNLGTIVRTAVSAGFNDFALTDCVDVFNPKVVRSSMGALIKANTHIGTDRFIGILKDGGYAVFAADMNGEDVFSLSEKPEKICLIIGSEADGIRPDLLKLADKIVSIPMQNTESLNAAVAAGILMYQLISDK